MAPPLLPATGALLWQGESGDVDDIVARARTGNFADAAKPADAGKDGAATDGKSTYPGLPTEKEQISYTIGMAMGKQLTEIKDEVNLDTVVKAMRTQISGEKLLLTEEQAKTVFEGFGQKMQAKQIAKMMADAKKNLEEGATFLAENAKKPGVQTTPSLTIMFGLPTRRGVPLVPRLKEMASM